LNRENIKNDEEIKSKKGMNMRRGSGRRNKGNEGEERR
jgi:hypothetical protein